MKKVLLVLCMFWLAVIFYNSWCSGQVSNERSLGIVRFVLNGEEKLMGQNTVRTSTGNSVSFARKPAASQNDKERTLNLIIRKNAHAFEYMMLAVLVSLVLSLTFKGNRRNTGYILFVCLLCAVMDEFLQSFIPGRTSSVGDMLIDFCGAVVGILLCIFVAYKKSIYEGKRRNNIR